MLTCARARRRATILRALAATTLLASAGVAHAGAFSLLDQSTKATGRAYSGEAAERGAQQQYFNPAAIGGITGIQSYFGVTAVLPRVDVDNLGTTVTRPGLGVGRGPTLPTGGSNQKNPINDGYLPNGGFAIALPHNLALGFTVASPYSFTTNYDRDSFARYASDKTRLRTFDFQPSLAWSPTPSISIGAGPNIQYVRATFANYLPDPISPRLQDGRQFLKGDGWDVGYSLGFQFHNDKVDLGASYKSAIRHKLKGKLILQNFSALDPLSGVLNQKRTGARAAFTTPWTVAVGLRYHLTPKFTANFQVMRMGWEKFDTIDLSNLGPVIGDQSIDQNYKTTNTYSIGFDYDVTPKLTLRGGVARDLSPIRAGYRDTRVPDGSRWDFAGGATYQLLSFFALDVAALYADADENPVDKRTPIFDRTVLVNGTSNLDGHTHGAHAFVFSVGGHANF